MSSETDAYMLGTSDDELERLGFQHQVWLDDTTALWRTARIGHGQHVVDLGSGPGFATLDLARLVGPRGSVQAVESSPRFLGFLDAQRASARLSNVTPVQCDVHALALPDASADAVFARWLLCFVADPAQVIAEAARVLKPGGAFVVMDYFNYRAARIFPRDAALESLFAAFHESALRHGGSYDIGERLPGFALEAGLSVEAIRPLCHVGRPGSLYWEWLGMFARGYVPALVEMAIWTETERHAFEAAWARARSNPGAFFATPPVLGMVARKPT